MALKLSAPEFWYKHNVLSVVLYPAALLYRCMIVLRRWYYKAIGTSTELKQILQDYGAKVLVVGNLTVGGVGKTPLVAYLATMFKRHDYRVAIVMRGYGGRARCYPHLVRKDDTAVVVGDEACMLVRTVEQPVVIDPRRSRAVSWLVKQGYNLILSDDGLQHYQMPRQGELVVFNAEYGWGNGWLLPAGPLREPLSRLKTVDWVVANYNSSNRLFDNKQKRCWYGKRVYTMQVRPYCVVNVVNSSLRYPVTQWSGVTVVAIAAIGCPDKFFATLASLGITVKTRYRYPDHYHFTTEDFNSWGEEIVIMTAKDAVKISKARSNFWYLEIGLEVEEELDKQLLIWASN